MVCQFAENPLLIKAASKTVCQHKNLILQAWHDRCPIVAFQTGSNPRFTLTDQGPSRQLGPHIPNSARHDRSEFSDARSDTGRAW